MNAEIHERKALEQDLRLAIEKDELFLNFQPQLEIASGRIIGAEALVRWRHKDRGIPWAPSPQAAERAPSSARRLAPIPPPPRSSPSGWPCLRSRA